MRLVIILFLFTFLLGQDAEKTENACKSDLIKKAKKEGMRSIKPTELPQYLIDLWLCRKETVGKKTMQRINQRTYEVDQENSAKFIGFTSSCAYCAATSVLIFYFVKLSSD